MNWIEVNIYTTTEGIDAVCGRLLMIGINGFVIKDAKDFEEFLNDKTGNWDYIDDDLMNLKDCETTITVYLADNEQGADMLSMLNAEMSALKACDDENAFGRLQTELANVNEEDWANNWKQYFKPIVIGEKLVIKPSWEEYSGYDNRTILEIDPGASFGTGQHHTTALCLEMLEKNINKGDKLLDMGCGSGILSIGGILLGAKSAMAIDIDQNSVNIAKENAGKNNISDEIYTAYCGNILDDETLREKIGDGYDIIAANIVADVLIAMSPLFKRFIKKDGIIVISGIICERCDEVKAAMEQNGYTLVEIRESHDWAAITYKN